jgi:hypothetical protein
MLESRQGVLSIQISDYKEQLEYRDLIVQQGEVNLEGEQNRVKELKMQCARLEQESTVLRTEAQKVPVPQVLG